MDKEDLQPRKENENVVDQQDLQKSVDSSQEVPTINIEEEENTLPLDEYGNQIYTSEWLKENTSIHGWLSFFLFALALGGLISAGSSLFTIKPEDYANNFFLICTDVVPGLCMLGVAIYTIYAFNERKANAVFYGKFYVALVLVTNLLSIVIDDFDETGLNTLKHAVRGVIWSIIWFIYLINSNQVEEIIPSSFRTITRRDWGIVAAIIAFPLLCLLIGVIQINNTVAERTAEEYNLSSRTLSENERTDGKMIFTIPNSFTCTEEEVAVDEGVKVKVYNMENEDIGNCTLCCDYDNDVTRKNFNEYRNNWKGDDASEYNETSVDEGTRYIVGNTCIYKISSYRVNGVDVYWRFFMLFDKSTGKVAVLSCYDRNENTDYVEELLRSIRFK